MLRMEYSIAAFGSLIADNVRMNAYSLALQKTIRPGCTVVDIGTGTGVMAFLACRLGAGKVVAVEPDDVIEVARQAARANGFADRIEFLQQRSTEVTLVERADVIVSDLRGVLPLHSGHIPAIVDARVRLLAPGGTLVPKRDSVWTSLVEAPEVYVERVDGWSRHGRGFDFSAAREIAVNNWWRQRVESSQLLSEKALVKVLDYSTIEDDSLSFQGATTVKRAGTAHGLTVWFDAELIEGVGFSNAPDRPEAIYGNAFFPLERPVNVKDTDVVRIRLRATPEGGDYVWSWSTEVERDGQVIAGFRQSTALGFPLTPKALRRSSAHFVPVLAAKGEAVRLILELMDGKLGLGEIARLVAERYPECFATEEESFHLVIRLAQKYAAND